MQYMFHFHPFCVYMFIILSVVFCLLPCFKHTTLIAMMNFLEE